MKTIVRLEGDGGRWRELELEGNKVTQRVEATDDDDGENSTRYDSQKEARESFDFLISRYLKNGQREVSRREEAPKAPVARKFVDDLESERACRASLDDVKPWRIYADWLVERGDLRGELASLWLSGKSGDAERFLVRHRDALLGGHSENDVYEIECRHGFVHQLSLRRAVVEDLRTAALVADVLSRPGARFVDTLKIGASFHDRDWTPSLAAVLAAPNAAWLRALTFEDSGEGRGGGFQATGNLSALWKGLAQLESLRIATSNAVNLGEIDHAALRSFTRAGVGLTTVETVAISAAKWPTLQTLNLTLGYEDDRISSAASLTVILSSPRPKQLLHLGFPHSELNGALSQLAHSPWLAGLRTLDLSHGTLGEESVDALVRLAPRFSHLERIDLTGNLLRGGVSAVRQALPNAVLRDQREYDDRYDEAGE
ncbi:MAG: hypothetical protein QM817_07790 [Archangium sp.]